MIIDLSAYSAQAEKYFRFTGEIDPTEMEFLDRDIEFNEAINYEAELFVLDEGDMEMLIKLELAYSEPCDRCLEATEHIQKISLSGRLIEGLEDDEYEGDNMENLIFYQDGSLDLEDFIKTQIYISLPMKTICDNQCKGLCSTCGINLNKGTCQCIEHTIDPRLVDLQKFFPKE